MTTSNHKKENCTICRLRIDKEKQGGRYCKGHSQYEVIQKISEYKTVQLSLL